MASLWCDRLPLRIGNYVFPSDLIVLESQGLDVILGMDWLSKYGGSIDCASKSIYLTTPERKRIKYVSRHAPRRSQVNSLTGVVQEEVHVVKDFPDVLPEELPGMPPDRDIEFLIELLPGTGPISKRPYLMPQMIWRRLRRRSRSYWRKVTSDEVHHRGEPQCSWLRRRMDH